MRRIVLFVVLASIWTCQAERLKPVLVLGGGSEKEMAAWTSEILAPLNFEIRESSEWVNPADWEKYSVVLLIGKLPGLIEENDSAQVEAYLKSGGVLIAVGTALSAAVLAEQEPFSSKFPNETREWIGGERCFYKNDGWSDYGPVTSAWPWDAALSVPTGALGTHPYGIMNLSTGESVVGSDDGAVIAVNRVGKGAFIFVGQYLLKATDRQAYVQLMVEAFTKIKGAINGSAQETR